MSIMIDKHGNAVDVPQNDINIALQQGYVYAPTGVTAGMSKSQIANINPIQQPKVNTTLQFKQGLSETQKKQLQNRLNSINNGSPITQTDINNFNYGLGDSWKTYVKSSDNEDTSVVEDKTDYKTGNSIIDAIVEKITPEQLATTNYQWTDTMQNDAKKIAEADFGPYYNRMFESEEATLKSGLKDYQTTYERDIYDTGVKKEQLQDDYTQALQNARRTYASSGLAYSSERGNKETALGKSLEKGLLAEDVSLGRTKEDVEAAQQALLQKGELRLGTSAVEPLKSTYKYSTPLSERYSGELELEKRKAVAEDIQRQKSNYTQTYV